MKHPTLTARSARSTASMYSPKVCHSHSWLAPRTTLTPGIGGLAGSLGAIPAPQFPTISVVTPCISLKSMLVLITASSSCACTSINPGATVRPVASISRAASPSIAPTAAMRPSRTATSARNASVPLPSITLPLRMWRSNSGMVARTVSSMSPARQRVSGVRRSLDVSRSFRASGVRPSGTGGGG